MAPTPANLPIPILFTAVVLCSAFCPIEIEVIVGLYILMFRSIVVIPLRLIVGEDPDTINDPVISPFPFLVPSHSELAVIPVNPDPSPTNDPENTDPDIAETPVKFTVVPTAPDTINDPVICALPFLIPFHVVDTPVNPAPFPTKEPEKTDADTWLLIVT